LEMQQFLDPVDPDVGPYNLLPTSTIKSRDEITEDNVTSLSRPPKVNKVA